ncbi:hypothetical protein [Cryptosporangium sp. NPDC051539]|uniref:hypothetical protein n=1 Tax=Cryptosporangium sp. NPDC051539 TaxID=3363962 RepID=UPI0037A5F4A7
MTVARATAGQGPGFGRVRTGHPHAPRVAALLGAAQKAAADTAWTPVETGTGLEIVVRGPGTPPGDATNDLGGLADALQVSSHSPNLDLSHLGVAFYRNDRQVRRALYSDEHHDAQEYTLAVSAPPCPPSNDGSQGPIFRRHRGM